MILFCQETSKEMKQNFKGSENVSNVFVKECNKECYQFLIEVSYKGLNNSA